MIASQSNENIFIAEKYCSGRKGRVRINSSICLLCFFYSGMAQARYIKLLQKVHPEKKGDVTSKDFHKQWLESCDEAEKEAVYQSSYSTYIFSGKLIGILLVVTMITHLFFNTGVFAIVVVGVIYLCITVKYCVSCVKLKNKS